jgi:DNA-binding beta-propeller fold protein YncE
MEKIRQPSGARARSLRRLLRASSCAAALVVSSMAAYDAQAAPSFTTFESGQVRPLALSPGGHLLFAVNTPDARLEVYGVDGGALTHRGSIPVGMEPVAVAARSEGEVWVVNHLSDSVSVVKISADGSSGQVVRTLLVGDEPRDIVFAGHGGKRAFVTTAHRGQNSPIDPQLTTPGVGRADVWVFDANNLGASLGGDPLTIVTVFSDTPRALAVSPDGTRVYAAAFHSGNRTTTINGLTFDISRKPEPSTNFEGVPAPPTSLVVQFDGAHWVDEEGDVFDDVPRLSLPDEDVFVLDATANPPRQIPGAAGFYTGVGTILYDMAVNPVTGKVYVSNTDARNVHRFEGPGVFAGHSVRGHVVENRVTVLGAGGAVSPIHLNPHIDYASCCAPVPNAESEKSLALPTGMAVSRDGKTLYVAALGSSKIGVFDTAALESDTFVPDAADQIELTGGGPTGVVLDDAHHRLYALTRFDDGISVIDTRAKAEVAHTTMYSPEPAKVVAGRPFLYDARHTSSHGDQACGSCHVFADFDSLAWDLGNPDNPVTPDPNPMAVPENPVLSPPDATFHPMKGPTTTQSLRGLANHGPMHWRGDRTGAGAAPSVQPDSGAFDERAAFKAFQVAFNSLLGRDGPIADADMDKFTDFILEVTYPPNPIRALDSSLNAQEQEGSDLFFGPRAFDTNRCARCHVVDPNGNPGVEHPGFFGTSGLSSTDFGPQVVKVPHFRNAYQKVGMFGLAPNPSFFVNNTGDDMGDQVRGFGFFHDGSTDTFDHFVGIVLFSSLFSPDGFTLDATGEEQRRAVEAFIMAADSNMAPIVGQQATLTRDDGAVAGPRIDLLEARAAAGDCDLVAKLSGHDGDHGYLYLGNGTFQGDRQAQPPITDGALRALASGNHTITFTCAPPGSGLRMALDRDEDGYLDGDEIAAGSDPADPNSTP